MYCLCEAVKLMILTEGNNDCTYNIYLNRGGEKSGHALYSFLISSLLR